MNVDLIVCEMKELQKEYSLSEQTAVEIFKMKVLCESLNGIERVLQESYNTI